MKGTKKKFLQVLGSLAAAVALLLVFFRQVSLQDLLESLKTLYFPPLALAVGLALASYAARAFRWGFILRPTGRAPFSTLLGCTFAGFATSSLLPARLGDLVRPLLLTARTGLPASATLASIFAERLLDLITVVGLALVALAGQRQTQPGLASTILTTAGTAIGVFGGLVLLVRQREKLVGFCSQKLKGKLGTRLLQFVSETLASLASWGRPARASFLALWSILVWGLAIAQVAVTAYAFHMPLTPGQATLVLAISVVGLAVPTPGGVGGFHAAVQFALMHVAGWPVAEATGCALVHHAICVLPVTVAGIGYMLAVGVTRRNLRAQPPL